AVTALGCADVATAYPEVLAGVTAAIGVAHNQFSNADDCNAKLMAGSSVLASLSSYTNIPGLPFEKLRQCGCGIVYAPPSCSAAAQKALDEVGQIAKDFFHYIGIDDYHQPPYDFEREKADYYHANYEPLLEKLLYADDTTVHDALHTVDYACIGDWFGASGVYDSQIEVCAPFYHKFQDQLAARQKLIADQAKMEAQAKADALQAIKDKYTDQARKYAMNWAQIKLGIYEKQCSDTACRNDVGVLGFLYYGMIATGMQDVNASNTAALVAANSKFDPLFKQKVAESQNRKVHLNLVAVGEVKALTAPMLVRAQKFNVGYQNAKARLTQLGVKDPDQTLRNAKFLLFRRLYAQGRLKIAPKAPLLLQSTPLRLMPKAPLQ
ncbi:MAG: hypothetical protein M3O03_08200, partial [Pseudomonadota bacterium]|nr:hypothetical protein [Pseudomonadota bacterium]